MGRLSRMTLRARGVALASVGTVAAAFLLLGATYTYWAWVEHRFLAVTDGQIYRSAAMSPDELLSVVREHGIRTVLDLRDVEDADAVNAEHAVLVAAGVKHVNVRSKQIPEATTVAAALDVLGDAENRPVLVHCEAGVGRAVLFSALYRIEYEGWSAEDARTAAFWGSGLGRSFLPDGEKGQFLDHYMPRSGDWQARRWAKADRVPQRRRSRDTARWLAQGGSGGHVVRTAHFSGVPLRQELRDRRHHRRVARGRREDRRPARRASIRRERSASPHHRRSRSIFRQGLAQRVVAGGDEPGPPRGYAGPRIPQAARFAPHDRHAQVRRQDRDHRSGHRDPRKLRRRLERLERRLTHRLDRLARRLEGDVRRRSLPQATRLVSRRHGNDRWRQNRGHGSIHRGARRLERRLGRLERRLVRRLDRLERRVDGQVRRRRWRAADDAGTPTGT